VLCASQALGRARALQHRGEDHQGEALRRELAEHLAVQEGDLAVRCKLESVSERSWSESLLALSDDAF
jgi:hypothetical protein